MKWLTCLFVGHIWETHSHPPEVAGAERAAWEDWKVCIHCGKDTREAWEIEDDVHVRLEQLELRVRGKKT